MLCARRQPSKIVIFFFNTVSLAVNLTYKILDHLALHVHHYRIGFRFITYFTQFFNKESANDDKRKTNIN